MKNWKTRPWSTPLTIGAGIFVALTGLIMFFAVEDPFKFAHELAGIAFSLAIALHVLSHWRSFWGYFRQRRALGIVAGAWVLGAGLVTASAVLDMGEPDALVVARIETAPLPAVAAVLGLDVEELAGRLTAGGFPVTDRNASIQGIAEEHAADTDDLLNLAFR